MMTAVRWLNRCWKWQCRSAVKAFEKATTNVAQAQSQVLDEILLAAKSGEYARQIELHRVTDAKSWQQQVPIVSYEDLVPWIERATDGIPGVLSDEAIRLFEPTSGSSGGEKLIPYTPLLQRQFQRGIQAWIGNLYGGFPDILRGRSYWSISPGAQTARVTRGGVPIGFAADVEYLNPLMRRLASRVMAVPAGVSRLRSIDDFRYATLCCLLACEDLALLSVWSPTYLTVLFAQIEPWAESMVRDIGRGRLELPSGGDASGVPLRSAPRRARRLQDIFQTHGDRASRWRAIWPRLALISCWCDASSSLYVPQLKALFPDVPIQPKGLLATEGMVSFPVVGQPGAALAITSHLFEFLRCDEQGEVCVASRPHLAHELERDVRYQVLLTTGGGLYRYRLGDIVEVVGFLRQCPLVRFLGRAGMASDLVGEKLSEVQVRNALDAVFAQCQLKPRFALLAPSDGTPPGYRLFLECDGVDARMLMPLARQIEQELSRNPYYRHAVALQQMRPVDVKRLQGPAGIGWQVYQQERTARGQKQGDIKPVAWDARCDWSQRFAQFTQASPLQEAAS